jgi:fumarylacetoacetate (FAA) hydrolase
MKLVTYLHNGHEQLAILVDGTLYDMDALHPDLPSSMNMFLTYWEDCHPLALSGEAAIRDGRISAARGIPADGVNWLAPVPLPSSCRDGYAFRQHVEAIRRNRGAGMVPQFDQFPTFYFTNHFGIKGPGEIACMPDHFEQLDFELEAAIVICRQGRNIPAAEADNYIGGLMIMNDLSARRLQMDEMALSLGPAKGKDFATVLGPWLVTLDELESFEIPPKPGHEGKSWNLPMTCHVNGIQVSQGNLGDMDWTFAELIERASYGVDLYPSDVIGSGTVGTGCFLELNGSGKLSNPAYPEQWLQPGDTVDLSVQGLGTLTNTLVREDSDFSLLSRKKNNG